MVGPALVAVILAVFLAERLWPAVPRPVLDRAHVVDAGYLVLFALIAPAVALMNTGFAVTVERYAPVPEPWAASRCCPVSSSSASS